MSRTKSSRVARIRDLVNNITGELDALQTETEELYQDQARLKEIEPALAKLQNALNPPTKQPEVPPTGEAPVKEQTISGQSDKPKRQRAKKAKTTDEQDEHPQ